VPSHSPLILSSDSGSSHDVSSFNEDKTDDEGSSPKSPSIAEVYKKRSTALGGSSAKSSSRKTVEAMSPETEDQKPSRRNKSDKQKAKGGAV
jgi:hypothetical protein